MSLPHELSGNKVTLSSPTTLNIIVGRNGAGKSRFLRNMQTVSAGDKLLRISYVSPERAGVFDKDISAEDNYRNISSFLWDSRAKNQAPGFKNLSAVLLQDLETQFLRKMQSDQSIRGDFSKTFASEYLDEINRLLSNVTIEQSYSGAKSYVFKSNNGEMIPADQLSSGEAEVIALASEAMYFFTTIDTEKINLFLLDEPDVHLHPDLQARFARFLIEQLSKLRQEERDSIVVIIATHSTPLICELSTSALTSIGTKHFNTDVVVQKLVDAEFKKVAPFFAHPLSKSISDDPILILEGEDDERVWQQATRTSKGRINLFPCLAGNVNQQSDLETFCSELLSAIYDNPTAFSLRDGDNIQEPLADIGVVRRFRLRCYAIENLLVSDECLNRLNSSWEDFQIKARGWLDTNMSHEDSDFMRKFIGSEDRFRHNKIKAIRNLICPILGSNKPWEVLIGQTIGSLNGNWEEFSSPTSIIDWIGPDVLHAFGI